MKSKVILRSFSRNWKDECDCDHDENFTMETADEQYSPSDFINKNKTSSDIIYSSSRHNSSSLISMTTTQSVIRPIPILPLDTSIYSSPPTYIDNLPPQLAVPMIPPVLVDNQLRNTTDISQLTQGGHSPHPYRKSPHPADQPELFDCHWQNCDRQFTSMDDLVVHVNDHHVRVERADSDYQCKWDGCPRQGKGFNARYKMLIHIRTHTNEKPHKCHVCDKSFSRLENLKIHMRSHTGEKPYTCPFKGCNKAYSNSSDRFKHVRTHQEDKPYICKKPGCNKRYTDPSSLRKHVRTHGHNMKESGQSSIGAGTNITSSHSSIIDVKPNESTFCSNKSVLVPICLQSSVLEIGTNMINHTVIQSNPLLSSTIIPLHRQTLSTQTDPIVTLTSPHRMSCTSYPDYGVKGQDSPLDLSTSSSDTVFTTEADIVTTRAVSRVKYDSSPQDIVHWEVIHLTS